MILDFLRKNHNYTALIRNLEYRDAIEAELRTTQNGVGGILFHIKFDTLNIVNQQHSTFRY